jgi:hypothetical protein
VAVTPQSLAAGGSLQSSVGAAVAGTPFPVGLVGAPRFTAGELVGMWKLSPVELRNCGFVPRRQLSSGEQVALLFTVPMMLL